MALSRVEGLLKATCLLLALLAGCTERARGPSERGDDERALEQEDGSRGGALEALERGDMDQFVLEIREEADRVRQWAESVEQDIERGARRVSEEERELFEAIQRDLNDLEEHLGRFAPTRASAPGEARAIQRRMRKLADRVQAFEAQRVAPSSP